MRLYVSYDQTKLELIDAEDTGLLGLDSALFGKDKTALPYTLLWEDALAESNHTEEGIIATLSFRILETADYGEATVSVAMDAGSTFNLNMENVSFQTVSGTVSIQENVPEKELLMIAVNEYPYKREYTVGDSLDTSGLTLFALYSDGSVETVTDGFICEPASLMTPGEQSIVAAYRGKETSFTVTVHPLEVVLIAVENYPYKTSYIEGDTLDTSGLVVTVLYSDGSIKTLTDGYECSPMFLSEAGNQDITVSYEGKDAVFHVTVEPITVQYLAVNAFPQRLTYTVGETISTEGLALVAILNNGAIETITSGYTYTPEKFTQAGTQTVTVTYGGQSTTYEVTVNEPDLCTIFVQTLPNKTVYYIDDTFVVDGLTLTAVYSDGSTQTVTEGFTLEAEPFSEIGKKTITITYNGFTTTFQVTVRSSDKWLRIICLDGSLDRHVNWWKRYAQETMTLRFLMNNIDEAVRFEWSSDSTRVHIDQSGNITNTGCFARSARITLTAYDADGNVVALSTATVRFYKFFWQYKRLQSQETVSDNIFMPTVEPMDTEPEKFTAFISAVISIVLRRFEPK